MSKNKKSPVKPATNAGSKTSKSNNKDTATTKQAAHHAGELVKYRTEIDRIDLEILRLLEERTVNVAEIGAIKNRASLSFFNPAREQEVLHRLVNKAKGPFPKEGVVAVFKEIISYSLAMEKEIAIAFFGSEASHTHQAALGYFGTAHTMVSCKDIKGVFEKVARGDVEYGVVPIENSLEGVVNLTFDMFVESDLTIIGELSMNIIHNLVSRSKNIGAIKKLFSHYQPLGQCRRWIAANLPGVEIVEAPSTSAAAEMAAATKGAAAICSTLAAELYGLDILAQGVSDGVSFTRFLIIGKVPAPASGADKTSIMFSLANKSGSLYAALAAFHRANINLTSIVSRPAKDKAWQYIFFVDFEGSVHTEKVAKALANLGKHCLFMKVLGSYPENLIVKQ